ncbi:hypothetical protein SKTS_29240 [Sulfurimicrobium lacus]|uniref:DUF4440 domain-containing protein n=1 Tax=Sulfurimicrobium lacus TaxID=2715678 RepID=A0A6F8VE96_9PROT|nr:hypothetical protein [Sulfurimicrobium lacus]BCB28038.1 hypothetical protein SKTS_29240 [Sulfurimicrobium lacus]
MRKKLLTSSLCLLLLGLAGLIQPASAADDAAGEAKAAAAKPIADLAEAQKAQLALDELIRAYETGNVNLIRTRLDPAMIGYQRLIDGVAQDSNALKQIRLHLFDTQVVAGPDVAVIQTNWEKRFLSVTSFQPGIFSGHSMFLMHRGKEGWRMAAVSGDNPFSSQSGVLGQIAFGPAAILAPGPAAGVVGIPLQIAVTDPDLIGQSTLTVELATVQGDRENVTLTAAGPGYFVFNGPVSMQRAVSNTPGDHILQFISVPTILSVRYLDSNPGSNRPPSMLTRSIAVQ